MISRAGKWTGGGNGVNSFTVTGVSGNAGTLFIAVIDYSNSSVTTTSLDTLSWVQIGTAVAKGAGNGAVTAFYAYSAAALAPSTVTISLGGAASPQTSGIIAAYGNAQLSGQPDAQNSVGSGGTSNISQSVTTVAGGTSVIGLVGVSNTAPTTPAAGTGQKLITSTTGGGFSYAALLEYISGPVSAGGSVTMNETFGGSFPAAIFAVSIITKSHGPDRNLRPAIFKPGLAR